MQNIVGWVEAAHLMLGFVHQPNLRFTSQQDAHRGKVETQHAYCIANGYGIKILDNIFQFMEVNLWTQKILE